MAGRPKGIRTFISTTGADISICSGFEGALYGVHISWNNLTVGDRVVIFDSDVNSGTKIFEFIIPTTAGSYSPNIASVGRQFVKGLFLNPQLSAITNDKIKIEVEWDGV